MPVTHIEYLQLKKIDKFLKFYKIEYLNHQSFILRLKWAIPRKTQKREYGGRRKYFRKTLEFLGQSFYLWKFGASPLLIPQYCVTSLGNSKIKNQERWKFYEFLLITPENSVLFYLSPGISTCYFFKKHSGNSMYSPPPPPPWSEVSWNSLCDHPSSCEFPNLLSIVNLKLGITFLLNTLIESPIYFGSQRLNGHLIWRSQEMRQVGHCTLLTTLDNLAI